MGYRWWTIAFIKELFTCNPSTKIAESLIGKATFSRPREPDRESRVSRQEGKNDWWKHRPATNMWTWMGGDYIESNCTLTELSVGGAIIPQTTCDGPQGTYTSQYNQRAGNAPGARTSAAAWKDKKGLFRCIQ
jgi:hypothetical protein